MTARADSQRAREDSALINIDLFQSVNRRKPSYSELQRLMHLKHETQAVRIVHSMLRRNIIRFNGEIYVIAGRRNFQPHLELSAQASA